MPLIYNEYQNDFRLALWSLTEPLSFFEEKANMSLTDKNAYAQIKNEARKREWLAVRIMLKDILGFWPSIAYAETGKPILQNHSRHLSISHSKSMVGILLSTNPYAGLDIENTNRSIDKVAKRFLGEKELKYLTDTTSKYSRIILWCAKEAIFKAVNETNIRFSTQIYIEEVREDGIINAHFYSQKENINFTLHYIEKEEHLAVWTT